MRVPGRDYYPEEWATESFSIPDRIVALNQDRLSKATPYSISPQIAQFTREFSERAKMPSAEVLAKINNDDWFEYYVDGESFWVPENRWAHEVQRPPVHIKDNIYAIYLDADIFIKPYVRTYEYEQRFIHAQGFNFVSRTLYKYIKETTEQVEGLDYYDLTNEDWNATIFKWVIRWLPRSPSKLRFFTDEDIENTLFCKIDDFVIECNDELKNVEVPVKFRSILKQKMPYIKHDSIIMYVEVSPIEKD
jgi:hypothetical protein